MSMQTLIDLVTSTLPSALGTILAIPVIVFISKAFINQWFDKAKEDYKQTIHQENEQYRIRNSRLHEDRANAIRDLYLKFKTISGLLHQLKIRNDKADHTITESPSLESQIVNHINELSELRDKSEIYLGHQTDILVSRAHGSLLSAFITIASIPKLPGIPEALSNIRVAEINLREEFRRLLGVEKDAAHYEWVEQLKKRHNARELVAINSDSDAMQNIVREQLETLDES